MTENPESPKLTKPLITREVPVEGDAVRIHYLLPNGDRRAVLMPSVLQTLGYHHEIGEALARGDLRIRGKRL